MQWTPHEREFHVKSGGEQKSTILEITHMKLSDNTAHVLKLSWDNDVYLLAT